MVRILNTPDVQERLRADGREPSPSTPDEFGRIIAREIATWTKIVKSSNMKVE